MEQNFEARSRPGRLLPTAGGSPTEWTLMLVTVEEAYALALEGRIDEAVRLIEEFAAEKKAQAQSVVETMELARARILTAAGHVAFHDCEVATLECLVREEHDAEPDPHAWRAHLVLARLRRREGRLQEAMELLARTQMALRCLAQETGSESSALARLVDRELEQLQASVALAPEENLRPEPSPGDAAPGGNGMGPGARSPGSPLRHLKLAPDLGRLPGQTLLGSRAGSPPPCTLREAEDEAIRRAMGEAGGNKSAAARLLGIDRKTLYAKLKRAQVRSG